MLTVYCGEDAVKSRMAFTQAVEQWKKKGAEVITVDASAIPELVRGAIDNLALFATQTIYTVTNLEKTTFRKSTKNKKDSLYEALVTVSGNKQIELIDWEEDKPARLLKLKDLATVHEAKPDTSVFKLLDLCIPGSKQTFIDLLRSLCKTQEEMFLFVMLSRHVRLLVLAAENVLPANTPPWQKYKIIAQAKKWDAQKLLDFYQGIIKIEIGTKTSSNPYGIGKSLEILACYYL
jgi:hypothetical protein